MNTAIKTKNTESKSKTKKSLLSRISKEALVTVLFTLVHLICASIILIGIYFYFTMGDKSILFEGIALYGMIMVLTYLHITE